MEAIPISEGGQLLSRITEGPGGKNESVYMVMSILVPFCGGDRMIGSRAILGFAWWSKIEIIQPR